ncbi:MAG: hypothetical protein QNL71_01200, partial [Akkermansiaceae bacterium]
ETLIALAKAQLAKADNRLFEAVAAANSHRELTKGNEQRIRTLSTISKSSRIRLSRLQRAINPLSPHSPPVQRQLQSAPAKSKFLAVGLAFSILALGLSQSARTFPTSRLDLGKAGPGHSDNLAAQMG